MFDWLSVIPGLSKWSDRLEGRTKAWTSNVHLQNLFNAIATHMCPVKMYLLHGQKTEAMERPHQPSSKCDSVIVFYILPLHN